MQISDCSADVGTRSIDELRAPEVTSLAASLLGVSSSEGAGPLLCGADELNSLSDDDCKRVVIAVYEDNPKQAYACRRAAYERTNACLTLSPQTAARLELLHPKVILVDSGKQALTMTSAFDPCDTPVEYTGEKSRAGTQSMTILFLTHDFRVGGLEQVVIDIAKLARSLGHKPLIGYIGLIDDISREIVEKAGLEHVRLPETSQDRKNFLLERKISIVNAHYATFLAQEAHELGIPYLQTVHNMYLWLDKVDIAQWQELDALTSGYIAVSANAAMVADLRLGLPPEKMVIVPNGVAMIDRKLDCPPERDQGLRAEFGIPPEGIVFVQVATLNPVKAHTVTVEAFAEALRTRQDIYLILLGKKTDTAYVEKVQEKIKRYNLDKHVFMPGYRKDVHRFLNLARAMLAPSFIEGWSLAVSEALQLGVPVVATDVGGACEQLRETDSIELPSFVEDVITLHAEDYFAMLTDDELHKKLAFPLAKAIVEMASRQARDWVTGNRAYRMPADAYTTHLEIMRRLIDEKNIIPVRFETYIRQRQLLTKCHT